MTKKKEVYPKVWDAGEYGALNYVVLCIISSLVIWVIVSAPLDNIIDMTMFWIVAGMSFIIGETLFIVKIRKEKKWRIPSFGAFFLINLEIIAATPWVYFIGLVFTSLFTVSITYIMEHLVEVMNSIMWFMIIIFMLVAFYALKKGLYEWVIKK
jgi:hypothetical protein